MSVVTDLSFPDFFARRESNRGRSRTCQILNIFIRFADIRCRILKSTKIAPNIARVGP